MNEFIIMLKNIQQLAQFFFSLVSEDVDGVAKKGWQDVGFWRLVVERQQQQQQQWQQEEWSGCDVVQQLYLGRRWLSIFQWYRFQIRLRRQWGRYWFSKCRVGQRFCGFRVFWNRTAGWGEAVFWWSIAGGRFWTSWPTIRGSTIQPV